MTTKKDLKEYLDNISNISYEVFNDSSFWYFIDYKNNKYTCLYIPFNDDIKKEDIIHMLKQLGVIS